MAIGERIRFFRNLRGMTQKYLGIQVAFLKRLRIFVWHSTNPDQEHQKLI